MRYQVSYTNRFKKDLKRCAKRGLDLSKILTVVQILENNGVLPAVYYPHKLVGTKEGLWECHISPDWLLVWEQDDTQMILLFMQTGTHSDILG